MQLMKRTVRSLMKTLGYSINRIDPNRPGQDPFRDMARHLTKVAQPTVFDVGANIGQSVDRFKAAFPGALMHSFEPSPATFAELQKNCNGKPGVKLWNLGVGAKIGTLPLLENIHSDMTSFLAPGPGAWGEIARRTEVPVVTLDSFTEREKIDRVHILKSDTQGYDFEVFKGAERLFAEGRVDLVYYEVNVGKMYELQPPFYKAIEFLAEREFSLVSFYVQYYQGGLLGWTDALFVSKRSLCENPIG